MINRVFNKLKTSVIRKKFDNEAAHIRTSPPVSNFDRSSNLIILSMVQKKDIDMYLLALKSFLVYIRPLKVVIVADPTIDEESAALFHSHIAELEIRPAEEFRFDGTPQGGCWERINAISQYNQDNFVIQLDADTLTLSEPTEVIESVRSQTSFTLGTGQGQKISLLAESADFARQHKSTGRNHIQIEAESLLDQLDLHLKYYVRGCAGFAGFAPGAISKELIENTSQIFFQALAERWSEWGSEQFMSNLIVANSEKVVILPVSKYLTPKSSEFAGKAFLHLIGEMRFTNTIYIDAVREFLGRS